MFVTDDNGVMNTCQSWGSWSICVLSQDIYSIIIRILVSNEYNGLL